MRLKPSDLEIGDVFYECEYGINLRMTVQTKPIKENGQWTWKASTKDGEEVSYLITEGLEHYGPRIYKTPMYLNMTDASVESLTK